MARFDLSDERWGVISPFLPRQGRGAKRGDDRKIRNGLFYILRTGSTLARSSRTLRPTHNPWMTRHVPVFGRTAMWLYRRHCPSRWRGTVLPLVLHAKIE